MLGKCLASPLLMFDSTVCFCSYSDSASVASSKLIIKSNIRNSVPTRFVSSSRELHSTAPTQNAVVTDEDENTWESCKQAIGLFGFSDMEVEKILGKAYGRIHSPYWGEERSKESPRFEVVNGILNYLKDLGLTDEDLGKLLKKFPEVLGCSLENELKTNVQILEKEWGIQGKPLRNLLLRNPKVLGYNVDCKGDCMAQCTRCWVESEVVESKEQGCSSEKPPEGHKHQYNLNPVSENQSHDNERSHNKVMNIPGLSAEASPLHEFAICIENPGTAQTSSTQDIETSQVTEVAHEEAKTGKGPCKYDLNQEVCSEDIDHIGNQTRTTSIVSASRDATAPGLPVSPVQFEANLGWKDSANKNYSPPTSPGQCSESSEGLTIGVISSTPKLPQGFYNIDLNIAESGDLLQCKQVPACSGLHSGESSMETDSRKSERHDLDLNLTSEDNEDHLPEANDRQPQSHSSSASSKQPVSIIDLNDQPFFLNDSYDLSCSSNVNVTGGTKTDESIISIMAARVKVDSIDLVPQTIPFPNGRTPGLTFDVKVGRTENCFAVGSALPYAHSSVYGYNNIAPVPEVVALPFSSSFYGSGGAVPYMVDSIGSPVIPQVAGAGFSQPLFRIKHDELNPIGWSWPFREQFRSKLWSHG